MPKVTVLINCLNSEKFINQAVQSVLNQTYENWEILIIDNCSLVPTEQVLRSKNEKIRVKRLKKTGTLGMARNHGLREARGDFIAILDSDDIWLPTKLEKQIPLFADQKVGLTYTDSEYFSDKGIIGTEFKLNPPKRGLVFDHLLQKNCISTETIMIRKAVLEKNNLMFTEGYSHVMDYEMTLELALVSKVDYVGEVLSRWRLHDANGSKVFREDSYIENSEMLRKIANRTESRLALSQAMSFQKKCVLYLLLQGKKRQLHDYGFLTEGLGILFRILIALYPSKLKVDAIKIWTVLSKVRGRWRSLFK